MADLLLVLGTSTGGVGTHVAALAEALAEGGHRATVAGPAATEELFGFTARGARHLAVDIPARPHPARDARALAALRPLVREADVVHAHGLRAGLLAGTALGRRPTPLVVTWHNAVLAGGRAARVYALLERRVARRADLTLCVSRDLVARVLGLGGRDVRLAPVGSRAPGEPGRPRDEVRSELGAGAGGLVLSVGRLHPQKGLDVLVRAAALLAARDPAPTVVVAGEGPARPDLEALVAATGAPVRLLGRRTDLADLLAAADVVAMPSVWEGSPLAAHEALLAGRPVVATSVGGLPDLLADGAGVLVPPGDPTALAAAIGGLLDDPTAAAALAARGRARAAQWPDADRTVAGVRAVYAELLGVPV